MAKRKEETDQCQEIDLEQFRNEVVPLDMYSLDEALENHTQLFDTYTGQLPQIRDRIRVLEKQLKTRNAELALEAREPGSEYAEELSSKYGKVTNDVIFNALQVNEELEEIRDELNTLYYRQDQITWIKEVFESRENAIRMLTSLYMGQYWGTDGKPIPSRRGSSKTTRADRTADSRSNTGSNRSSSGGRSFRRRS